MSQRQQQGWGGAATKKRSGQHISPSLPLFPPMSTANSTTTQAMSDGGGGGGGMSLSSQPRGSGFLPLFPPMGTANSTTTPAQLMGGGGGGGGGKKGRQKSSIYKGVSKGKKRNKWRVVVSTGEKKKLKN